MKLKLPNLTWRTRKRLKTTALVLGSVTALTFLLWLCWVLWLGRFVVYSREGVRLDFDWVTPGSFVAAVPPEERPVNILYDDGSETVVEKSRELAKYYREQCDLIGAHFLDADTVGAAFNQVDYMHLTRAGHAALASALAELVPQLVQ